MTTLTVVLLAAGAGIAGGPIGWALCLVARKADDAAEAAYRRRIAEREIPDIPEGYNLPRPAPEVSAVDMGEFLDSQCLEIRRLPGSELPARRPSA